MEKTEMIEKLKNKVNVSYEKAKEALEKNNWDILDALVYLENEEETTKTSTETTIIDISKDQYKEEKSENTKKTEKKHGIGTVIGRIFRFIGRIIKKGNKNYFEISKEKEEPVKITLTISVLLFMVAFWPVAILLIIGLFVGYKYSISGPNFKNEKVNNFFDKASKSAEDIKNDFNDSYKNV